MEQKINLKRLEKDTVTAIFQTGVVEIEIGLILLISSLAMIFDDISYFIDIFYFVPIVFIIIALKSVVYPRMGVVVFKKSRVRKGMIMGITITTFLLIMVALNIFGKPDAADGIINPRLIISGIIFFICLAIAFFLEFNRMYIYAFFLVGIFNLSEEIREHSWILKESGYADLFASFVMILIGSVYLIRFLKRTPIPEKEVFNGQ